VPVEDAAGSQNGSAREALPSNRSRPDALDAVLARAVRQRAARRPASGGTPALARMAVTGTIEPTLQGHHPTYAYAFPTEESVTYDLDAWITKKQGPSPVEYAATGMTKGDVDLVINGWDTAQSIFAALNAAHVGTAAWAPRAKLGAYDATVDVPAALGASDAGKLFTRHFLTLQENVALRERDIPNSVPSPIKVKRTTKKAKQAVQTEYRPNWSAVVKAARDKLKLKLQAHEDAPEWKDHVRLVDDVVLSLTDPALKTLHDLGLLYDDDGEAAFKTKATSGTLLDRGESRAELPKRSDGVKLNFNFGIGHLRFMLWLEWRALDELRKAAQ
jgi:hypothetical protein